MIETVFTKATKRPGRETDVAPPKPALRGDIDRRSLLLGLTTALAAASLAQCAEAQAQTAAAPLASWNEGPAKETIQKFVRSEDGDAVFRRNQSRA